MLWTALLHLLKLKRTTAHKGHASSSLCAPERSDHRGTIDVLCGIGQFVWISGGNAVRHRPMTAAFAAAVALPLAAPALATDLEVTHWWTSGGEAAAVAEFAKAFDATGNKWVDGAIAGAGDTARPIMISRITGGDPMGATQFNHGRQAEELVRGRPDARPHRPRDEGELGEVDQSRRRCSKTARSTARSTAYRSTFTPGSGSGCPTRPSRMPACPVPTNWDEFVAAAPCARKGRQGSAGPRQQAWQESGAFNVLMVAIVGKDSSLRSTATRMRSRRRARHRQGVQGSRRRPQDGGEIERPELERGHQSGDHRPGWRPDHGRLGAG